MRNLFYLSVLMNTAGAAGAAGGGAAGASSSSGSGADPGGDTGGGGDEGHAGGRPGAIAQKKAPVQETQPKKYKIKVDQAEEEIDEAEVVRRAQIGTAAHKRMQKAAEIERREQEREARLKTPKGLLELARERGYKPEELRSAIEEFYNSEYLRRDEMTPEQLELERYREQEKKREEEDQKREKDEAEQQREAIKSHHKKQLTVVIKGALEELKLARPDIEPDEDAVKLAAREAFLNRKAGIPVDSKHIAAEVARTIDKRHGKFFKTCDLEGLRRVVGDDGMKRLLKMSIEYHRSKSTQPAVPRAEEPAAEGARTEKKDNGYIRMSDWQNRTRK